MQMQTRHTSTAGRNIAYIRRFLDCRHYLGGAIRILSFGCGRGGELAVLRGVFPEARILGCDTQDEVIAAAQAANPDTECFHSTPRAVLDRGPYDLIVCNSVLCRFPEGEKLRDLSPVFPFKDFNIAVRRLVNSLNHGGIFTLWNSNYLLRHTTSAAELTPVAETLGSVNGYVSRFGRGGKRLARGDLDRIVSYRAIGKVRIEYGDLVGTLFMKGKPKKALPVEAFPYPAREKFDLFKVISNPLLDAPIDHLGVCSAVGGRIFRNREDEDQNAAEWTWAIRSTIGGPELRVGTYWMQARKSDYPWLASETLPAAE